MNWLICDNIWDFFSIYQIDKRREVFLLTASPESFLMLFVDASIDQGN